MRHSIQFFIVGHVSGGRGVVETEHRNVAATLNKPLNTNKINGKATSNHVKLKPTPPNPRPLDKACLLIFPPSLAMIVFAIDDDGSGTRISFFTGGVTAVVSFATGTSANPGNASGTTQNAVSMVWYGDGGTIVFQ